MRKRLLAGFDALDEASGKPVLEQVTTLVLKDP